MSNSAKFTKKSVYLGCVATSALAAGLFAYAGAARADDAVPETVVITGTLFQPDAAPAKASLDTTEPQTIINQSYIQNYVPPQSDYVNLLAIVPSLTGGDTNGPGLSDGGAKNTLRGLPDGDFAMQYDGIPFGDTNGPSHHNISYFPASTIGSIDVDRGPGNAGNLGASTYGGTIKLFSETLSDTAHASASLSYGSFGTGLAVLNGQSGDLNFLGTTKVLVNLQGLSSNGALTEQNLETQNYLVKVESDITSNWTVTLFGTYSHLQEHLDDNNGLTPAQFQTYGKDFALQNTNPSLPTYYAYNYTTKATDMDYLRENGAITDGLKLDNTTYTYAYWNHTMSPNSQTQTASQIGNITSGAGPTSGDTGITLFSNGSMLPNDLLSYDKENEYRVFGDTLRLSQDYNFGWVTGQIRIGAWGEWQATHRFKYFFDANLCNSLGIDPFDVGGVAAAQACGAKSGKTQNGPLGFAKDDEYSDWSQYEPFLEVDIKPTNNLTITPGVKYIDWYRSVNAPIEQGSGCGVSLACPPNNTLGQNYRANFTTTATLPFLQANYKIEPSWSVYAEYAEGIYVPDISAFETKPPTAVFPQAETTTNYQLGTVYYADNFTLDGDIYYIAINNNYVSATCSFDTSETCFVNNGKATYAGIEGEGTYAVSQVPGLSIFANGALMSSKQQSGLWEPNAPYFTFATGLLYNQNNWRFGFVVKTVGQQYSDSSNLKYYELPPYTNINTTLGYSFGMYDLSVNIDNLLNERRAILITEGNGPPAPPGIIPTATEVGALTDQYFFQAPRSVMLTLKAHI